MNENQKNENFKNGENNEKSERIENVDQQKRIEKLIENEIQHQLQHIDENRMKNIQEMREDIDQIEKKTKEIIQSEKDLSIENDDSKDNENQNINNSKGYKSSIKQELIVFVILFLVPSIITYLLYHK